jgi:phospholipase C
LALPNPQQAPIDRIVVLMMENRSFDHYFGWLTDTNQQTYADPDAGGASKQTFHLAARAGEANPYRGCGHPDPDHSFGGGRQQQASGFLAGRNDEFAIGYYLPEDVELYARLARQFTVCDNYFCSLPVRRFPTASACTLRSRAA